MAVLEVGQDGEYEERSAGSHLNSDAMPSSMVKTSANASGDASSLSKSHSN